MQLYVYKNNMFVYFIFKQPNDPNIRLCFIKKFTTELFYKDFGHDKKIVMYLFNEPHKYKSEKTKQNCKIFMDSKVPNSHLS